MMKNIFFLWLFSCSKKMGLGVGSHSTEVSQIQDIFSQSETRNLHVALLIDSSGSMKDNSYALFDALKKIFEVFQNGPFKNKLIHFYAINSANNKLINSGNDCCSKGCETNPNNMTDTQYIQSIGENVYEFSISSTISLTGVVSTLKEKFKSFKCGTFESTPAALNVFLKNNPDKTAQIKKGYLLAIHLTDEVAQLNGLSRTYPEKQGYIQDYNKARDKYEAENGKDSFQNYFGKFVSGEGNPSPLTGEDLLPASTSKDVEMWKHYIISQLGYLGSHIGLVKYSDDINDFYKKITSDTGMASGDLDSSSTEAYNLPTGNQAVNGTKIKDALETVAGKINDLFTNSFVLSKVPKDPQTIKVEANGSSVEFTYQTSTNSVKCKKSNDCKNKTVIITYTGYDPK